MLSDRQRYIVGFLISYQNRNGFPPSLSEIAEDVGLASKSSVSYQIGQLELMGYVERVGWGPRNLRVLRSVNGNERKQNDTIQFGRLRNS